GPRRRGPRSWLCRDRLLGEHALDVRPVVEVTRSACVCCGPTRRVARLARAYYGPGARLDHGGGLAGEGRPLGDEPVGRPCEAQRARVIVCGERHMRNVQMAVSGGVL